MRRWLISGWVLLLGVAGAQNEVVIPRLEQPLNVDGDLSDWSVAALTFIDAGMTADAEDVNGDEDLSVNVFVAYDETSIYIGAEVTDDVTIFEASGNGIADNDALEFWLNANQYAVALVEGKPVLHQYLFSGVESNLMAAQVGFQYTSAGYNVEVAVPLSELAIAIQGEPKIGLAFPFAVGADDADERGGARLGQLYYPTTWTWSQTDTYATAVLGD